MGKYCTAEAVKIRLEGKVKFDVPGGVDPNKMSLALLNVLIEEAESQLELDLMDRYDIPLQRIDCRPFSELPETTRITLKNLAELVSILRVLETDFGRGTSANSEKYTEKTQKRYDDVVLRLMEKQEETKNTSHKWKRAPLNGLKVAYNNTGDNGFRGRVMTTTTIHHEDYALKQINSPAENIFNNLFDTNDFGRD